MGNGKISLEELMNGFDRKKEMRGYFAQLGIARGDLEKLFDLFYEDEDGEEEFSYEIMMKSLQDIIASDQRKNFTLLRLQSEEMVRLLKSNSDRNRQDRAPIKSY